MILALIISAPVKSLHDCNNLAHHHNELSFENSHNDCSICDINIHSPELHHEVFEFIQAENTPVFAAGTLPHFYSVSKHNQYLRGPPSI